MKKYVLYIVFAALTIWVLLGKIECPLRTIVGIPCLLCGMTRAWTAFFRGDLCASFIYHPLFFTVPIMIPIIIRSRHKPMTILMFALLFSIVYAVRMTLYFPDHPPMTFNTNSLIYRIITSFY